MYSRHPPTGIIAAGTGTMIGLLPRYHPMRQRQRFTQRGFPFSKCLPAADTSLFRQRRKTVAKADRSPDSHHNDRQCRSITSRNVSRQRNAINLINVSLTVDLHSRSESSLVARPVFHRRPAFKLSLDPLDCRKGWPGFPCFPLWSQQALCCLPAEYRSRFAAYIPSDWDDTDRR